MYIIYIYIYIYIYIRKGSLWMWAVENSCSWKLFQERHQTTASRDPVRAGWGGRLTSPDGG